MINIIKESDESFNTNHRKALGVERFEYIWEAMIDYVYGEDNREKYYPGAHWHIVRRHNQTVESSELRPDTIMRHGDSLFILDAKYYKYGITGYTGHLPNTDSIQKQITYGNYAEQREFAERNQIFNAFLMPFAAPVSSKLPYEFVSVGTADWLAYGDASPNYQYVLGILVDTRYLLMNYVKHSSKDIEELSQLIVKSLKEYRVLTERN